MGDLMEDTSLDGADGSYRATLSPDWEIWGPNGGYLTAVALRAAGAHTRLPRPASVLCHFLGVAVFGPVELEVETLRASRRAESMRVSMTQGGQRILESLVWAVDDGLEGLSHEMATAPELPGPEGLPSIDQAQPGEVPGPRFSFFDNLEARPIEWIADHDHRPAGDPVHRCWYRFRPVASFADRWVDAGRLAIAVDTFQWPAASRGYAGGSLGHIAPSLDLACRFHRMEQGARADWLLVEARSPVAAEGLVGGIASVWDEQGRLLASGGQQMLCRPTPVAIPT
jgi:acyl-CoA thioesterase